MVKFFRYSLTGASLVLLTACDQASVSRVYGSIPLVTLATKSDESPEKPISALELSVFIKDAHPAIDLDAGFAKVMLQALDQDPVVTASRNQVAASKANLRFTESGLDTKFSATVLGGIEDVTDETAGVAAILTANRLLYDGGLSVAKIDADKAYLKSTQQAYLAVRGERAVRLANAWIELERYQSLQGLINSRVAVLDPLLVQLEGLAGAGLGDVSQVASAQRVVSSILVAQMNVSESHEQAKIAFINGFGQLPERSRYDASWLTSRVPELAAKKLAENSPGLLAKYWAYRAAEASVVATKAQDEFNIGFQVKLQRPFGGSDANSDESIGLALTKNIYRRDQLKSQVERAEETARSKAAEVYAAYREGEFVISSAREMIKSLDKAISLAQINAKNSHKEIEYLRKQLIIGGSTLESILSAEARLYEAESKEIGLIAERQKAEVTILGLTGYFDRALSKEL